MTMNNDATLDLPTHCFVKQNKIWYTAKSADGTWRNHPTPYRATADQVELARAFMASLVKNAATAGDGSPMTVGRYLELWLTDRATRGIAAHVDDRVRMEKYVVPYIGTVVLTSLRPLQARDLVRTLKALGTLAPRTINHIYWTLHNAMANAVADELVPTNPITIRTGELPKRLDADPSWRSRATYATTEIERLVSDAIIPVERRVMYALKAIAGLRHGEAAALTFRHLDMSYAPLGKLNVVQAYCSRSRTVKSTKTEVTRAVPIHPVLASLLAAWKLTHWERIYGRAPTEDDFVVPTRAMNPSNAVDASHAMKDDLAAIGLRVEAGKLRDRGGHDLRSWYQTQMIEDDANPMLIRRTTHASGKDINSGYERYSW